MLKLCLKCLTPSEYNEVSRKHKGKYMNTTTHQCPHCGSYTFYSGDGNKKK